MTVTVVGMNQGAVADSEGRFTLNGVRPGPVRLQFTGAGVNAVLELESVAPGETLNIIVSVAGTTAVLESRSSTSVGPSDDEDADEADDEDTSEDEEPDEADDQEDDDADEIEDDDVLAQTLGWDTGCGQASA
jgi:hypothetical protein